MMLGVKAEGIGGSAAVEDIACDAMGARCSDLVSCFDYLRIICVYYVEMLKY